MADDVQIAFGAKTEGIDQGAAAVKAKLQDLQNQTNAMSSAFEAFGTAAQKSAETATEGLEKLSKVVEGLNDTIAKAGNVSPTSGLMGSLISLAGRAGPLGAVAVAVGAIVAGVHHLGEGLLDIEHEATRLGISFENLQNLQSGLALSGVKAKEISKDLTSVSDAIRDMKDDSNDVGKFLDKNEKILGVSKDDIKDINGYLRMASFALQQAVAEGGGPLAAKVGETLKLSEEMVRALQKGPVAFDQSLKKAKELGTTLDAETIHKAAQFTEEWDVATTTFAIKFKAMLAGLVPAIMEWGGKIYEVISAVFRQLWAALKLSFEETAEKMAGDVVSFSDRFKAAEGSIKPMVKSLTDARVSTESILGGFDEIVSTGKKFDAIKFPGKDEKFDPTAMIEFRAELDKNKEKYEEQKIAEQSAVDTFKQTETEKVAHLKSALADRVTADNAVLAEMLMKYGDNAKQRARIELEAQKLIHQAKLDEAKLDAELLRKKTQEWEGTLRSISTAFTSQLRGILTGTTTWAQAIKNIMLDLVLKIIDEFLLLAVIKPLSGMLASALQAPSEIFGALIKVITGMFGPLFAGFTAFFAPVQGPAAPAEGAALAAATVAAATAAVKLDTGTDYVPRTGMALIHQGEAIIPASENIAPYSGGGSSTINLNLSTLDASSFHAWLRNSGGDRILARMVAQMMNSNPTLRPSY